MIANTKESKAKQVYRYERLAKQNNFDGVVVMAESEARVYQSSRWGSQGGQRVALGPRQGRLRPQELGRDAVAGPRFGQANGVAALQGHCHPQARQVFFGALAQLPAVDVLRAEQGHVRRPEVGIRQERAQVGARHVV